MMKQLRLIFPIVCLIGLAVVIFNRSAFSGNKATQEVENIATPEAPTEIKFIDPHVHAMSVTPLGLRAVAAVR